MSKNKIKTNKDVTRGDVAVRAVLLLMILAGHVVYVFNGSPLFMSVLFAVAMLGVGIWTLVGLKRFVEVTTVTWSSVALVGLTGLPVLFSALGA